MKFKFLVLITLIVAVCGKTYASDPLVVDKLIHRPMDLTAATSSKVDLNGKPCGLLKVISNDTSFKFEGNVIGTPEYKTGEYWVYLTAGTYMVKIKSNNHDPLMLNFRDYNIKNVESKNTYELTFHVTDYDKLFMKNYKHIEGPRLKKYAFEVLTLPSGLRIGGMMSLEYMQRLAKVLAKEGDGWGEKHNCTILGDTEGGDEIVSYKLIMDSTEDEFDAILGAAAAFGGYHPIILQVVYD